MILSCNSCEKKFVVPDNAISASGRLVQCSSCGNKWKQFPNNKPLEIKEETTKIVSTAVKIGKVPKKKVKRTKKRAGPNLYSPEYLSKKHGIIINEGPKVSKTTKGNKIKISFGFYNSLIMITIIVITILRLLYFAEEIVIKSVPFSEIYINYLFESLNNIKDIIQNFFSNY